MKTKWEHYKQKQNAILQKTNNFSTEVNISNEKFEICKKCPELVKTNTQCRKCGCFMNIKTLLNESRCPIGKW
jgi:hypothetical protein